MTKLVCAAAINAELLRNIYNEMISCTLGDGMGWEFGGVKFIGGGVSCHTICSTRCAETELTLQSLLIPVTDPLLTNAERAHIAQARRAVHDAAAFLHQVLRLQIGGGRWRRPAAPRRHALGRENRAVRARVKKRSCRE